MVTFSIDVINDALHRILRVASALSYGCLVLPFKEGVNWPEVRARRVPQFAQWPVERENFKQEVVSGYAAMERGAVRLLVAGTGVGKSTVMPYVIASEHAISGLVLMPNNALPVMSLPYLTQKFIEMGGNVKPFILRTRHVDAPEVGPTLYFCSASDFLARLARRPSMISDMGIEFIYLDECHEVRPEYTFFKYAKHAGILGDVKVFYGTATAASDINMEDGSVGRTVSAKPVSLFPMAAPTTVSRQSPLHYDNIQDRTLIFVATDAEAMDWAKYYDNHDVPVMAYLTESGNKHLSDVPRFLDAHALCVLLVPPLFQTGFTLNVDTSICTGKVTICVIDFATGEVQLRKRNVTQAERVQRMGRVGRYKPGRGFYADVEPYAVSQQEPDEVSMYVYLWAKVFNMTINDPSVSQFNALTGALSSKAAAILLHSRVHPYLMLPYVANAGFYKHWGRVMKYAMFSSEVEDSDESNADKVVSWNENSTGPVDYSDTPIVYKCPVRYPKEWVVLPALAWKSYADNENVALRGFSTRSVISAVTQTVVPDRTRRSVAFVGPSPRSSVSTATQLPGYASRERVVSPPPPYAGSSTSRRTRGDSVPSVDDVLSVYSLDGTVRPVSNGILPRSRHSGSVAALSERHAAPDVGATRVQEWQSNVRSHPRLGEGSESSGDHDTIELMQVRPEKYMYSKFYPMDVEAFSDYVADESVGSVDRRRVDRLLSGKENYASLPHDANTARDKQKSWFISILRVHNASVSKYLQFSANVEGGFFSRAKMTRQVGMATEDYSIRSTVGLLKACALQNYYVGIDKRSLHLSLTSSTLSPVFTEYESNALVMLAFGDVKVREKVLALKACANPIDVDGKCLANAWFYAGKIITVAHAVDEDDSSTWPAGATGVFATMWQHDLVIFDTNTESDAMYIRMPKIDDQVYIITVDRTTLQPMVLGCFELLSVGDPIVMDFILTHGYSGALLVSVDDGAIVGMYRGEYATGTAWVIPMVHVREMLFPPSPLLT
jgi:hypothetical protein